MITVQILAVSKLWPYQHIHSLALAATNPKRSGGAASRFVIFGVDATLSAA